MGVVLFSGAIIISLLALRARAPQWLLMFCGGWTLFTLLNVTWQPLMFFQLALIWGGYAFIAPQGLSQRKLWKSGSLIAVQNEATSRAKGLHPEPPSTPVQTAIRNHRSFAATEAGSLISSEKSKVKNVNRTFIAQLFLIILSVNIALHLYPFNYPSILAIDEIARAIGSTLGIFLLSLVGRFFKPSKTFGMALITILLAPIAILADRANDPVAPQDFRELLRPGDDVEISPPLIGCRGRQYANSR